MANLSDVPRSIYSVLLLVNSGALETVDGLVEWLSRVGLRPEADDVGLEDVVRVAELRDGLKRWITSEGAPPPRALESLNRAGRMTPLRLAVDEHGLTSIGSAVLSPVDRAIGEVLAAVHHAVAAGLWDRLRVCRDPACGWVFFDRSRNRSGVWCDMAVCGNRAKARTYRARGRAGRS